MAPSGPLGSLVPKTWPRVGTGLSHHPPWGAATLRSFFRFRTIFSEVLRLYIQAEWRSWPHPGPSPDRGCIREGGACPRNSSRLGRGVGSSPGCPQSTYQGPMRPGAVTSNHWNQGLAKEGGPGGVWVVSQHPKLKAEASVDFVSQKGKWGGGLGPGSQFCSSFAVWGGGHPQAPGGSSATDAHSAPHPHSGPAGSVTKPRLPGSRPPEEGCHSKSVRRKVFLRSQLLPPPQPHSLAPPQTLALSSCRGEVWGLAPCLLPAGSSLPHGECLPGVGMREPPWDPATSHLPTHPGSGCVKGGAVALWAGR